MDKSRLKIIGYYAGIACGIIFVVAFLTSQIIIPVFFGRAKTIEIPDTSGLSSIQAKKLLIDKKLHAVVKDSTWSEEIDAGKVISQKPDAGDMIKPDGTVYLIVSRGSKSVRIPEVIGLNVQAAWILLKNATLKIVVADSMYSDVYPPNTVVQTIPEVGQSVDRKSKIKVFISKGSASSADTTGMDSDVNY
jgi:eukaryotic-like serine/threonine-protein kinase